MRRSLVVPFVLLAACANSPGTAPGEAPPAKEVERIAGPVDLSGEWNDVDADLVASSVTVQCLESGWIEKWKNEHDGKKPVVRLYPIRNRTVAYIDYRYFTKQIESALVNSDRVDVLMSLEELEDEEGEAAASANKETGADFVLNGTVVSQDDKAGDQEVRAYLVSIELVEVETNKKVWVAQKRIRKLIRR